MLELADRIGRHHLPVRESAHEIGEFLGDDAIHHDLVKNVVRSVYKANRCGHLNAPVFAYQTFDAIGAVRGSLLRSTATDVDAIRLLDQLDDQVGRLLVPATDSATNATASRCRTDENSRVQTDDSRDADSADTSHGAIRRFNAHAKRSV